MRIHPEIPKNKKQNLKFLYNFLKAHKLAVMASVTGSAMPEAAIIGFGVTKNLEIICSSFVSSRKYDNIQKNPHVALVIGWEKGHTVQYEGIAEELSQREAEKQLETTLAKIPTIAKYLQMENRVLYKIKPKWIRFSDLSEEPWERFEISF